MTFSADINIATKKRVAFCVVFLVLSVLVQGEERNLGEDYFIQFVSFFGTRKKNEDNPPGIKNLNNSRSHRADRFGNENTVIIELKIEK